MRTMMECLQCGVSGPWDVLQEMEISGAPGYCDKCGSRRFSKGYAFVEGGRRGGSARTEVKAAAVRENGRRGGRPPLVSREVRVAVAVLLEALAADGPGGTYEGWKADVMQAVHHVQAATGADTEELVRLAAEIRPR